MFISHFNRYFEKHARITYFVLLIIIIATFVIFVTPGDVFSSNGRRSASNLGSMYGRKLKADQMQRESSRCMLGMWLQYPYLFGQNFSNRKEMLFQATLHRMRMLHEVKKANIAKATDEEVRKFYASFPMLQENGAFSTERMDNFVRYIEGNLGIKAFELDEIVRENIMIERLQAKIVEGIKVSESDVDAELLEYTLKVAQIKKDDKSAMPTDAEAEEFFKNRKADIKMPQAKNAAVAVFKYTDMAKNVSKLPGGATMTASDKAISDYYAARKDGVYKGKTLDAALKAQIAGVILNENIRSFARNQASRLSTAFANGKAEDVAKSVAAFKTQATANGASMVMVTDLTVEKSVAGIAGETLRLADAIRSTDKVGASSNMIVSGSYAAVALITKAQEAKVPEKMSADLKDAIKEQILRDKALAFYTDSIKTPYENYRKIALAVRDDKSLTEEERRSKMAQYDGMLDTQLVLKFFIQETRGATMLEFPNEKYLSDVPAVTDEQLKDAFEARKAEFEMVQVRLARIVANVKGLNEADKKAKIAKLASARAQLQSGKAVAEVAKQFSDEKTSFEDKSLRDIALLSQKVQDAIRDLKQGAISADVEENDQVTIYKVVERREARTLNDVKAELTQSIRGAIAQELAYKDASAFAGAFADAWWKANGEKEKKSDGVELLKSMAAKYPKAVVRTWDNVSPYNGGYANDQQSAEVIQALFAAKMEQPVVDTVRSAKASFVGLLTNIVESHLGDPVTETRYFNILRRLYIERIAMDNAKAGAEAEAQRLTKALADGKTAFDKAVVKEIPFDTLNRFSANDVVANAAVTQEITSNRNLDLQSIIADIRKLGDKAKGAVLPVQRIERSFQARGAAPYQSVEMPIGYDVIYIASVDAPVTPASAEVRKAVSERLLQERKQEAMGAFIERMTADSKTVLLK